MSFLQNQQTYTVNVNVNTASVGPATQALAHLRNTVVTTAAAAAPASQSLSRLNNAVVSTNQATQNAAMRFLSLAHAIQDFQAAGIRGVANNIPMLIAGLGGGPGLAGTAMLAAVAFDSLNGKLVNFNDLLSQAWKGAERTRAATVEAAKGATDAMMGPGDAEQARQKAVNDVLRNRPGGVARLAQELAARAEARGGLAGFMPDRPVDFFPRVGEDIQNALRGPQQRREEEQRRMEAARAAARKWFEEQLRILAADPARLNELSKLIGGVDPKLAGRLVGGVAGALAEKPPPGTVGGAGIMRGGMEGVGGFLSNVRQALAGIGDQAVQGLNAARDALRDIAEGELRLQNERKREQAELESRMGFANKLTGGALPGLAEQMAAMMSGPGGMNADDAYHAMLGRLADQLSTSRIFGGMGMNPDDAMTFAARQLQGAMPMAEEMAARNREMFPDARELARQQREMVTIHRRMLSEGIRLNLRQVGWR